MQDRRLLPAINSQQAKILFEALQNFQAENASLIHGWTLTENAGHDVDVFTDILSMWGEVEELKNIIVDTFPDTPAY
jgi:hypothetical protein